MTFTPTMYMMDDLVRYTCFMEYKGAREAGAGLVVPPKEYKANAQDYNSNFIKEYKFDDALMQMAKPSFAPPKDSSSASFRLKFRPNKLRKFTVQQFYEFSRERHQLNVFSDKFWEFVEAWAPFYLKDSYGSFMENPTDNLWNLGNLTTPFSTHSGFKEGEEDGLVTPYLYLSEAYSAFCDHVENWNAYSLNLLHFGHAKIWRVVPPSFGLKFVSVLQKIHMQEFSDRSCDAFPAHKSLLVPDKVLQDNNIVYNKIVQYSGTFVITFPFSYHSGYATGFICGEAVNYCLGNSNWASYAVSHYSCPKKVCKYGYNTTANPQNWIENFNPAIFKRWFAQKGTRNKEPCFLTHPEDFSNTPIRIDSRYKPGIPTYYTDPMEESLEEAYKLRGIYQNESELKMLSLFDKKSLIDSKKLQIGNNWFSKLSKECNPNSYLEGEEI